MFTGIVETIGILIKVSETKIAVRSQLPQMRPGESVAVNGACLTVTHSLNDLFEADISDETKSRTTLGQLMEWSPVNLERPVAMSGRLGGHVVTGHVDAVVKLLSTAPTAGDGMDAVFELPLYLSRYVVEKGSIAVDGVSLTVASLTTDSFRVSLIPHTILKTNLASLRSREIVNLEADILAKHVEKLLKDESVSK